MVHKRTVVVLSSAGCSTIGIILGGQYKSSEETK